MHMISKFTRGMGSLIVFVHVKIHTYLQILELFQAEVQEGLVEH